jgi:hypothetical protein
MLVIEPWPGQLTSDAGLLPIRQFDERIGLTRAFADALDDPRDPDLIEHTILEMVRSRVYGILAGYADQNDPDTLRADPAFKRVAGRSPRTTTWRASLPCRAARTPSPSSLGSGCGTCSSISSSPRSRRRPAT